MAGSTVILYGMIGVLGAQIWKESGVDFGNLVNMVPVSAGVIIGIGGTALTFSDSFVLGGISLGTIVVVLGYHLCRTLAPRELVESLDDGQRPGRCREPVRRALWLDGGELPDRGSLQSVEAVGRVAPRSNVCGALGAAWCPRPAGGRDFAGGRSRTMT